jgi:hypothetical protein
MSVSLADLEQQRTAVLRQISELEDFRAGSITTSATDLQGKWQYGLGKSPRPPSSATGC